MSGCVSLFSGPITVHAVLELSTTAKLDTLGLDRRQGAVQYGVEEVVRQCPARDLPACQSPDPVRGPPNFAFQFLEVDGLPVGQE